MKKALFYSITFLIFALSMIAGNLFWTSTGLAFTFYIFIHLLDQMGEKIPILELMTALASLQWILGPVIEYNNDFHHYRYFMYVEEAVYMSFIVPSVLAFWVGSNIFRSQIDLETLRRHVQTILEEHPYFPYILIIVGMAVPYLSPLFPSSLLFVFFLLSMIKYIGAIYLIQSKHRYRWHFFIGILFLTVLSSIGAGMFHDLLLWSMLLFTFLAKELKLNLFHKISFAVIGIFLAITIQAVKSQYRAYTWYGYEGNKSLLFLSLVSDEWKSGDIFMPKSEFDMNVRLNQGWIISAVMFNVPDQVPYAKGETIKDGIVASLLPRFIAPNKPIAGGQKNFRKFTGLYLGDNTAMGISIAGEGYANYGPVGGILFMFLWGLFISWFWRRLEIWSKYFPTLLIWSPLLFLQVVKAETEFGVVLNHLFKASIVVFGLVWLIRTVWGTADPSEEQFVTDEK